VTFSLLRNYAGLAVLVRWLGYGLDDRGIGVQFLAGARDFALLHSVKTGSLAPPRLLSNWYRIFPRAGKAAGA
jgi:hypothetical protein